MITKQKQKQLIEGKVSPKTLKSLMTISRMGSLNASIATNMDTWQKNANQRRKNMKSGNVSNVRKKNILSRTAKEHSQ